MLDRIAESGGIFWAQSDRVWTLDGAAVQVSMVGFDDGKEETRELDGVEVSKIYTNLTSGETDTTKARKLKENLGIAFMGDTKGGPFDIPEGLAKQLLAQPNPDGRSNEDVVRPWINGSDITGRRRNMWIIDFPPGTTLEEAALYEAPFGVRQLENVKPFRTQEQARGVCKKLVATYGTTPRNARRHTGAGSESSSLLTFLSIDYLRG